MVGLEAGVGGDDEAEAARVDLHLDEGAGFVRLAVGVDQARVGTLDEKAGAAQAVDAGVVPEPAEEEARDERGDAREADGADGDELQLTVIHPGAGGDQSAVAVLVGVGDGDQ
jgi:hypothetical protein